MNTFLKGVVILLIVLASFAAGFFFHSQNQTQTTQTNQTPVKTTPGDTVSQTPSNSAPVAPATPSPKQTYLSMQGELDGANSYDSIMAVAAKYASKNFNQQLADQTKGFNFIQKGAFVVYVKNIFPPISKIYFHPFQI